MCGGEARGGGPGNGGGRITGIDLTVFKATNGVPVPLALATISRRRTA